MAYSDSEEQFLAGQEVTVDSSHHRSAQYDPAAQAMLFTFTDGGRYKVAPISPAEALEFLRAPSKGEWYWDNVRVRGKGNFHLTRKTVARVS
jgi:hypothetical protein